MWRNGLFITLAFISLLLLNACVADGYNKEWDVSPSRMPAYKAPNALTNKAEWPETQAAAQKDEPPKYGTYYGRKQANDLPDQEAPPLSHNPYAPVLQQVEEHAHYVPTAAHTPQQPPPQNVTGPPVKVALLVPMSGKSAGLGQSMLNAAQMALFDLNYPNFELMPRDTKGTPEGARQAAESAINDGAQLILGPLFASSVRSASTVARQHNVNMIAFSTDWSLAGRNTFIMGFLPFAQLERVLNYSTGKGYRSFGVIAPQTTYGDAIIKNFHTLAGQYGINTVETMSFSMSDKNISPLIRRFAKFDTRRAERKSSLPFHAVLMPVGGEKAMAIANLLSFYDLDPYHVKRIGTGLWDDPAIARDPNMEGAWFAAPSPGLRKSFEARYKNTYLEKAPRLASLAYDATALAAVLGKNGAQQHGKAYFSKEALTNPNGFSGIDGIFRFNTNGLVERGLAVLEIKNGTARVIDDAPKSFQRAYVNTQY